MSARARRTGPVASWLTRAAKRLRARGLAPVAREQVRAALVEKAAARAEVFLGKQPLRALPWAEAAVSVVGLKPGTAAAPVRWRARRLEAKVLHANGRHAEALRALDALARLELNARQRADVESTRAALLSRRGRMDEALGAASRARRAFLAAGDRLGAAHVDINEGNIRHRQDRHARALALYRRARRALAVLLASAREAGEPVARREHDLGLCELGIGNVLTYSRDVEGASRAYEAAIAHFERAGAPASRCVAAYNAAYLELLAGRPQAALDGLARVREQFASRQEPRGVANCDLDRAEIFLFLGAWPEAESCARAALSATESLGMPTEAARARLHLARSLARRRGTEREVADLLEAAGETFRGEGNEAGAATAGLLCAEQELRAGRPERALVLARQVIRPLSRQGMPSRAAQALVLAGRATLELGSAGARPAAARRQARALALEALALVRSGDWSSLGAWQLLAQLDLEEGDVAGARRHADRAMRSVEQLAQSLRGDATRACLMGEHDAAFAAGARAWMAGPRPRPDRAFECAERARRFALAEGGSPARSAAAARAFLAASAGEGAARIGRGSTRRQRTGLRRGESGAGAGLLSSAGDVRELPLLSLEQARGLLRPGDALVEMLRLGPGERAALVVTSQGERLAALDDGAASRRACARLAAAAERAALLSVSAPDLAGAGRDAVESAAAALAGLILEPLAPELASARRLLVVADPAIASVPFGLLPWRGRPLAETMDVLHLPSAAWLAGRPSRPRGPAIAKARPVVSLGLGDAHAPSAEDEARAVAASHPDGRAFTGAEATAERLFAEGDRARVVHVACHGAFRGDAPWQSALRLADGWLAAGDIEARPLRCEVLLLSACQGGAHRAAGQEGQLLGPVRAFLRAGARQVVASPWTVSDRLARMLFARVAAELAGGASLSASLRAAQQALPSEDRQAGLSFTVFGCP